MSFVFCLLTIPVPAVGDEPTPEDRIEFNIPQQRADLALTQFAEQANLTLLFPFDGVRDRTANALTGEYKLDEAIEVLLAGTGLTPTFKNALVLDIAIDNDPTIEEDGMDTRKKAGVVAVLAGVLAGGVNAQETADSSDEDAVESSAETDIRIPEILVVGQSRNVGIRRTKNDSQPFVTFDETQIEASGAVNLEDFLRTHVPQNTQINSNSLGSSDGDTRSRIGLRGLGNRQTLILINGRRTSGINPGDANEFGQVDINGIPLAAIERIEVLPATASAIYGGRATGGVINIILKSGYQGFDVTLGYESSFETDADVIRLEAIGGFGLEGGRTNVTISASYVEANELLSRDRDFAQKSRALQLQNNPDYYLDLLSPPLGATPNISALSQFDFDFFLETGEIRFVRQELVFDDGTPLGSTFTFVPEGYPGIGSDGGAALLANAGLYNLGIDSNGLQLGGGGESLIATPTTYSLSTNIRREFTSWLDAYVDVTFTSNEGQSRDVVSSSLSPITVSAGAPNNPFNTDISVTYPFTGSGVSNSVESELLFAAAGFVAEISPNWALSFDYSRSETTVKQTQFIDGFDRSIRAALFDGSLDVVRDVTEFPLDFLAFTVAEPSDVEYVSTLENVALRLAGSIYDLPGGAVSVSTTLERREETLEESLFTFADAGSGQFFVFTPERSLDVNSAYFEVSAPIVQPANDIPFVELLELQFAARYDDYDIRALADGSPSALLVPSADVRESVDVLNTGFSDTNYTVSGRYSPVEGLILRASYATGMLPPSLANLSPVTRSNSFQFFADPQRGNVQASQLVETVFLNGNPNLDPEESESFSVGVIFEPNFLAGLRLSIDYISIEKSNEIASIGAQALLDREDQFPGRVIRAPLEDGAPTGFTAGQIVTLDIAPVNIASSERRFVDYQIDYDIPYNNIGDFSLFLIASQALESSSKILETDEAVDLVGFTAGVPEWQVSAGLNWTMDAWSANYSVRYFDSFKVNSPLVQEEFAQQNLVNFGGVDEYESRTVHDLFVNYRFEGGAKLRSVLNDTTLRIGIRNLFDEQPVNRPEGITGTPQPFYNGVDPRLRSYTIELTKSF